MADMLHDYITGNPDLLSCYSATPQSLLDTPPTAQTWSPELVQEIQERSYQIDRAEANLTIAVMNDPLRTSMAESNQVERLFLDEGPLLDEPIKIGRASCRERV